MPTRAQILLVGLAFLAGFGSAFFAKPARVVTKTEFKDRIVTSVVTEKASDVVTVRREVDKPDGTKTIRTVTVDRSVITDELNSDEQTAAKETREVDRAAPNWTLRALAGIEFSSRRLTYGAGVDRRILGPFSLGVFAFTNGFAGASLALTF